MAWNQPGNNIQHQLPWWRSKNKIIAYSSNKKNCQDTGSSNVNDIFRKIINRFKILDMNKSDNSNRIHTDMSDKGLKMPIIYVMSIATVVIWASSGFYTIKEAERGVVSRFGKFSYLVQPGLNWKPTFIDEIHPVNVESVRELAASGMMLTADENVVRVEMNVQYRVTNPENYLFSVVNADDSLSQATDSALRAVIGKYSMDLILTEGRTVVRNDTQRMLEETIRPYNMGITLLDVNFQTARPPEEVKASFDDAIAARENKQQYICEAEAYANEVQPRANGQAQRLLEDAKAYKARTVLEAQGEVARFTKLLPEYKLSPDITRERLYIETMEKILSHTRKVMFSEANNNSMLLMLDPVLQNHTNMPLDPLDHSDKNTSLMHLLPNPYSNDRSTTDNRKKLKSSSSITQRQAHLPNENTTRVGRE